MKAKRFLIAALALTLSVSLFGCSKNETGENKPESPTTTQDVREGIDYIKVDAPTASKENGVITAEEWAKVLPDETNSYDHNGENDYIADYLEQDPYLKNIYEGYGFAKEYGGARAHNYTLEDVAHTARPHPLANCLTCKTADFTALVNKQGTDAYSLKFDDVYAQTSENVGCYTCHENKAGNNGELAITHDYTMNGLGDSDIPLDILTCGQCHIEYYFNPETKATSIAYTNADEMHPDKILAYYDSIDFADWTQESTGAKLLKAQHPEMETYLSGSVHAKMGLSCADCHMATETNESGRKYVSHKLESPLYNQALLDTCASCHGKEDMAKKVINIQQEITAEETKVGNALSELKDKLAAANTAGTYSEDKLNELRNLYRKAQWYFDFCYVENSEGAHNSQLAKYCLKTSQETIDEANQLF